MAAAKATYITYVSHHCDAAPTENNLRKEGFILARSLRDTVLLEEKAWEQECEAAADTISTVRK